jgi:hypothetical protein
LIETASGELVTPSVVTPPPEFPVSVTAPPELISTNFETVALIVTVPVVDCAKQVTAATMNNVVSRNSLVMMQDVLRGIGLSLEEEWRDMVIRPSARRLTAGAMFTAEVREKITALRQ